jgi:hypothetical protein
LGQQGGLGQQNTDQAAPSGLGQPGSAAPSGLGNAPSRFAGAGADQNAGPGAAPAGERLEPPQMGQLNREPAAANPPGRPGEGQPRPARQANRPRLESPQMGQLNRPLAGRENPDANQGNPPPGPAASS